MNPDENGSNFVSVPGILLLFGLFLAAMYFEARLLAAALLSACAFSLAALLLGRKALDGVQVSCRGESLRVFPGETVRFTLTIENRKWMPLFWLTVLLPKPDRGLFPVEPGQFHWILPWQEIGWQQEWKAGRRGVYPLRAVKLISGDGFGLLIRRKLLRLPEGHLFVVYPREIPVRTEVLPFSTADLDRGNRGYLEDLSLLKGTRGYQPGDSIRRMNWRMLAKQGTPAVNVYETLLPVRSAFVLDLASFGSWREVEDTDGTKRYYVNEYAEDALEEMISLAASVLIRFAEQGRRCVLALPRVLPVEKDSAEHAGLAQGSRMAAAYGAAVTERDARGAGVPERREQGAGVPERQGQGTGVPERQGQGVGVPNKQGYAVAIPKRQAYGASAPRTYGVISASSQEEMVPELLLQLASIHYEGGPAWFPASEIVRDAAGLGQIFVFTKSLEALTCGKMLERLPEHRICMIPYEAGSGTSLYRVVERRELLA